MLGDSAVRQDVNWHHDSDAIYGSACDKFTQAAPPLAIHTQFKAACQRSELFHTMLIPSMQHARLQGDRRRLGWKHGVSTVISSQHGLALTCPDLLDDIRQAVWRHVKLFLQLPCFFLMVENSAITFFYWVDLFQSMKAGEKLLQVDWKTQATKSKINFGWTFMQHSFYISLSRNY